MTCRLRKFKKITTSLLILTGIYVIFMILKLTTGPGLGSRLGALVRTEDQPKRVVWRQPYWLRDDEPEEDYDVPEIENSVLSDGLRVYPYKGIKGEILSIRRALRDTRPSECRLTSYSYELMPVTIVIVFHNEYIGVLLRSLYSLVTHTPKELLTEIVFVDDASTQSYLGEEFERYVEKTRAAVPNIRIVRLPKRLGANRAVLEGIRVAKTDHVVLMTRVLDVNKNWLPPLLTPLVKNPKTVAVPVHEFRHWKPNTSEELSGRGMFDLQLKYLELPKLKKNLSPASTFRTPVIPPQSLFVVSKEFLRDVNPGPVGGQDGNFIELSLKVWGCDGRILKIPCSRVSHNFRESGLHDAYVHDPKILKLELQQTIQGWFDDYQDVFRDFLLGFRNDSQVPNAPPRTCKGLSWFLSKVAPDFRTKFLTPPKVVQSGRFQSLNDTGLCLAQKRGVGEFLVLKPCEEATTFDSTRISDIRHTSSFLCWEGFDEISYRNTTARFLAAQPCSVLSKAQRFAYVEPTNSIYHLQSDTCLEVLEGTKYLWLVECEAEKSSQRWQLI